MRKIGKALMVFALICSLALPGCLLCSFRPGAMAASAKIEAAMDIFQGTYQRFQEALALAQLYNLPDLDRYIELARVIKGKVDHIYFDVICPIDQDALNMEEAVGEMKAATASLMARIEARK